MLFNWLIIGQVVPGNPAAAVRGPKHVVKIGKTPVLDGTDWRKLLDAIPTETVRDLRDRALIATLTYSFARIGAALKMKVEDLRAKGAGWQILLHKNGGKEHVMPCHHSLAEMLQAYLEVACIAQDRNGYLFRTSRGHSGMTLSDQPMSQPDAWRMIRRRVLAVGIMDPIGNNSFRATGITAYLSNGGALEHVQDMAAHESPRTTTDLNVPDNISLLPLPPYLPELNPMEASGNTCEQTSFAPSSGAATTRLSSPAKPHGTS